MKYKIEYQFGKHSKICDCESAYDMEQVMEFMLNRWGLKAVKIYPIMEEDLK